MSKPATDIQLQRSADRFTQVIGRGNAHIITKNPTTGKCAYDGQIGGGWHYNEGQETDTAWEQDAVAEYLKMVKAGYNLRARKLFNAGDLIQYIDPVSGQYVKFQPVNFQWIDGTTGSNSLISVAQAISAPTIDDDKLYWPAAFGPGRNFRYIASPTRLIKHLIIDSAANLPACPAYITNPWLELTFTLKPSSGVIMYVDGVAWDQATTKTTANAIEFRLPSGQVVWQLAAPTAYDSSDMGEPCAGQIKLYVNKKVKYAAVRFPKSWIDSAIFPIVLDPTVDYQVGAGANDGSWGYGAPYGIFSNSRSTVSFGSGVGGYPYCSFFLFTGVTFPVDATISVAYMSFYRDDYSGDNPTCKLYFEDAANPSAVSSDSNGNGRVFTTNCIDVLSGSSWWNTNSIIDIIEELKSYDYSAGKNMQCFVLSPTPLSVGTRVQRTYEAGASYAAKLHIEYTEAAAGGSLVIPSHRRRFQTLSVR